MFIALTIQHAKHMCTIILLSVACMSLPHFFTLSHKQPDFHLFSPLKEHLGGKHCPFSADVFVRYICAIDSSLCCLTELMLFNTAVFQKLVKQWNKLIMGLWDYVEK